MYVYVFVFSGDFALSVLVGRRFVCVCVCVYVCVSIPDWRLCFERPSRQEVCVCVCMCVCLFLTGDFALSGLVGRRFVCVCVCLFLTGDFALSGLVGRGFVYVYLFLTSDFILSCQVGTSFSLVCVCVCVSVSICFHDWQLLYFFIHNIICIQLFISHYSSVLPFNANIKAKIVKEICANENCKYTGKQVTGKMLKI